MTTSANEPLEYAVSSGEPGPKDDEPDAAAASEQTEHAEGGYDDRQESLEDADHDLFERKDTEDPKARYRPEQHPLSEPRKQDD